jgi:hypothetical protein
MDTLVVAAFTLPVIAYGFGGRFYWANRIGFLHDTWYHLLASEKIRENGHRLPAQIDHFIFDGPYDYPPGLHWFLSFFSEDVVTRYNWLFAPCVEVVHGVGILSVTAYLLTGEVTVALVAVAIYAISPEPVRHFISLTPRVVGSLLFSLTFLSTLLAVMGRPIFVIPALLLGGVLLLTHKMSTQTLAFTLVAFTALEGDPAYLGLLVAIIAFALVLSRGHYIAVLRSHLAIINFWRIQRSKGNPPSAFMRDYGRRNDESPSTFLARLKSLVIDVDPVMFGITNGWLLFLPVPLFVFGGFDVLGPFERQLAIWALVIMGIAILTQYVPGFKLVGEGHKYYMWGAFPCVIVLGRVLVTVRQPALIAMVLALGAVSLGFIHFMMQSRAKREHSPSITDAQGILEYLSGPDVDRIMSVPPNDSYTLAYKTRKKVLWHDSTTAYMDGEPFYPTPRKPLEELAEEFDINAIVVDSSQVTVDQSNFQTYVRKQSEEGILLFVPS